MDNRAKPGFKPVSLVLGVVTTLVALLGLCLPGQALPAKIRSSATLEEQIIALTNAQRQQFSLAPLQANPKICEAARDHSAEMIQLSYFEHVSPTPGQTHPSDRLQKMGVQSEHYAENIYSAEGYPLPQVAQECIRDWMNSPHHRANILDHDNVFIGVGGALHMAAGGSGLEVLVTEDFTGALGGS